MPLGLLAKDSIQDLEALGREAEQAESSGGSSSATAGARSLAGRSLAASKKKKALVASQSASVVPSPLPADAADPDEDGHLVDVMDIDDADQITDDGDLAQSDDSALGGGANPQQAQEDDFGDSTIGSSPSKNNALTSRAAQSYNDTQSSYGQYAGFRADYAGFHHDYGAAHDKAGANLDVYNYYYGLHDSYAPVHLGQPGKEKTDCWTCLFPWMSKKSKQWDCDDEADAGMIDTTKERTEALTSEGHAASSTPSGEPEDDTISTNSDVLGERLSDKERQAVLARLGLARPDAGSAGATGGTSENDLKSVTATGDGSPSSTSMEKGLLNGIPTYDLSPLNSVPAIRGILKNRQSSSNVMPRTPSRSMDTNKSQQNRRSLFPSSYETPSRTKANFHVSFAPMARVVTVKSKNDMSIDEKGDIWWQKSDYEDFRRTGRIITKAMLEGGGEIWLQGTPGGGSTANGFKGKKGAAATATENGSIDRLCTTDPIGVPGDKWWHKFGHSRRGLEHVVSFEEGRQRQMNVRTAIQSVLEEQDRQRRYKRVDHEKLRIVSLNNTSWARDLALAAGASDADAVRSSFAEDRKSREFFLLKIARASPSATTRRVPEFMQPVLRSGSHQHSRSTSSDGSVPGSLAASPVIRLDANTATQIRFRHDQTKEKMATTPEEDGESCEPVRDASDDKKNSSMAQRGKGFSAEGDDKVDMGAVLAGMGAVPQDHSVALSSSSSSLPASPKPTANKTSSLGMKPNSPKE